MATRHERVIVEAVDQLSTPFAKMAASAALLDRSLDRVDGSTVGVRDSVADLNDEVDKSSPLLTQASRDIDRYSGRLRLLGELAMTIGPAFVPIGAAAVPALAGLTAGLGAAVGAVGTAVLAFNGMGDALESISAYRLEPTVENLDEMRAALAEVGPEGAKFARFLADLAPAIDQLQNGARAGMFPGMQEGIESLLPLLPQVERIVSNISTALGELAADAGDALASERFEAFFDYLETDAGPTLDDFGRATGNVAEGLSHLMVAFAPLSRSFSGGLESMTRSFADWAEGLSETDGFQEFVAYVRQSGPQVLSLIGSLGNAFVGLAQAAAPFGQAVVPALTALADVFSAIARSPIGPPLFTAAAGFMAISRASTLAAGGVSRFNAAAATGVGGAGFATKVAGVAAAFGILGNEIAKLNGSKVDFSELEGNLDAIASGGGADALGNIVDSIKTLQQGGPDAYEIPTLGGLFGNTPRDNAAEQIEAVDQALARMVTSGNADKAAKIFGEVMSSLTGMPAGTSFTPFGQSAKDFDAYAKALGEVGPAAQHAAKGVERAEIQAQRTRAEMVASRNAARETARSFLTLGDSLSDSSVSLGDWIGQMQKQADALRNFSENAINAAKRGLSEGLIKELQSKGPEGALRMKQLADSTQAEIDRANRAWRSGRRAVKDYTDAVGGVGKPNLDVNSGPMREKVAQAITLLRKYGLTKAQASLLAQDIASGKIKNVQQLINQYGLSKKTATALLKDLASGPLGGIMSQLNALDGKVATSTVRTIHETINRVSNQTSGALPRFSGGGTVPKTGLPYADRHLYLLADGERITSNRYGQVDKATHLLDLINAGKLTDKMVGLADGGTVGRAADGATVPKILPQGTLEDRLAIVQAMQQIRDLTRDLNARVKKGKHKGELVTTGIDRQLAELQLKEARKNLAAAENREKREREAARKEHLMDRYRAALGKELERETAVRDRLSEAVDRNQAEVDRLTGLYENLAGTIRSSLDVDTFARVPNTGNAWNNGGKDRLPTFGEAMARLNTGTDDAYDFIRGATTLRGILSGAALESVLSQGLDVVSMMAAQGPEALLRYQSAFDTNAIAKGVAGEVGAQGVYGRDLAKSEALLSSSVAILERQTLVMEAVQQAVDRASGEEVGVLREAAAYLSEVATGIAELGGKVKSSHRSKRGG